MTAPMLKKTVKPLTLSLTALLLLTLFSTVSAAQSISATYNLKANMTTSTQRHYTLTGAHGTLAATESGSNSVSANGTATVDWLTHQISANGSISITRDATHTLLVTVNSTILITNSSNSQTETSKITFSGSGAEEAIDFFGPLNGHLTGTLENYTINGQTYLAIHVSRSVDDHFSASAQDTTTKVGENGHTITITLNRTVTRDITLSADFWFSKTSGILLKSFIQGSISIQVTANGSITDLAGTQTFTMSATYKDTFSRTVTATSIIGLSA